MVSAREENSAEIHAFTKLLSPAWCVLFYLVSDCSNIYIKLRRKHKHVPDHYGWSRKTKLSKTDPAMPLAHLMAWLDAQVVLVCEGLCSVLSLNPRTVLKAELGLKALTPLIHSHEL